MSLMERLRQRCRSPADGFHLTVLGGVLCAEKPTRDFFCEKKGKKLGGLSTAVHCQEDNSRRFRVMPVLGNPCSFQVAGVTIVNTNVFMQYGIVSKVPYM